MRDPTGATRRGRGVLIFHPSDDNYGLDRVLVRVVEALSSSGKNVHCVLERDNQGSGWLAGELATRTVTTVKAPLGNLSRSSLSGPLAALRWIARAIAALPAMTRMCRCADVVYVNGFTLLAAALAGRLGRRPVIWHIHEIPPASKMAGRIVTALSDRQICVSRAVAEALGICGRKSCEVIYNAVDLPAAPVDQPVVSDAEPLEIGIVARINRHKGHLVLAEAFAKLLAKGLPVRLHIAGSAHSSDRSVEQQLRQRLAKLPAEAVVWAGEVASGAEYMQRLHVLAAPSTFADPFPIAVLEGMAAGLPVVATATGGHCEALANDVTGLLCKVNDADDLAGTLARLVNDAALRRRLGESARLEVARRFSVGMFNELIASTVDAALASP